jgi:hypothetical protein
MDIQVTQAIDAKGQKHLMPLLLESHGIKSLASRDVAVPGAAAGGSRSGISARARKSGGGPLEAGSDAVVQLYVIRKK